jgi:hypothetical protein
MGYCIVNLRYFIGFFCKNGTMMNLWQLGIFYHNIIPFLLIFS